MPGPPTAKQSARFARGGRVYRAADVEAYSARVMACAVEAGVPLVEGAVEVSIVATKRMPGSWSKRRRAEHQWQTTRPDLDNLAKAILDPLNGVAWHDDRQVVRLSVRKEYGARDQVAVSVAELKDGR